MIRPWELDRMQFKDVVLAVEGFNDHCDYNQHLLRRATFIISSAGFNGKSVITNMNKTWPVDRKGGQVSISERNKQILAKFKEIDDKQKAKEIYARRTKDSS